MSIATETRNVISYADIVERVKIKNTPPITRKAELIAYLKSGEVISAAAGRAKDLLTGKRIPEEWLTYTDGVYHWDTSVVYHVDKYDMALPDEFITHALGILSVEDTAPVTKSRTFNEILRGA